MVLFSEDHIQETRRRGRIEVICGSMFSGKTIDTRYSEEDVVSHDSHSIASTPIDSSASILLFTSEIDVVGIDEAQFFDSGLIDVCNQLANNGIRVIIAGLDMDFKGNPFGPMPQLCAIADEVSKVHAICVKCGQPNMSLCAGNVISVHERKMSRKYKLYKETDYGKEKDNIRQFYTRFHRMCVSCRNINARGTS